MEIDTKDNELKVQVIGAGGAFDTDMINSAFIVSMAGKIALVDCGWNVFAELKNRYYDILKELDVVYITHMDDDHVGSLKTLLYYRYFTFGKTTEIRVDAELLPVMASFLPENTKLEEGVYVPANIHKLMLAGTATTLLDGYMYTNYDSCVGTIKGDHHVPSFGFMFAIPGGPMVAISGDTKANKRFEDIVKRATDVLDIKDRYILHDFSLYNVPYNNVHACESDIESTYSAEFAEELVYYHNSLCMLRDIAFTAEVPFDPNAEVIGQSCEYLDHTITERTLEEIVDYLKYEEIEFKASASVIVEDDSTSTDGSINEITIQRDENVDKFDKICSDFNVVGDYSSLDILVVYFDQE